MKTSLPPLTDEQLASAELTMVTRDRARQEALEAEQEQATLAAAGEPEGMEALKAGASALFGRAIETPPPKKKKAGRPPKPAPRPDVADTTPADDAFARDAYKLMDTAFKKWQKKSERNPREAFRDLARDLGADTAIYLKAGILRMSDMLDSLMKLTALGKPKEEEAEGGEDFDAELDSLRDALRGGK